MARCPCCQPVRLYPEFSSKSMHNHQSGCLGLQCFQLHRNCLLFPVVCLVLSVSKNGKLCIFLVHLSQKPYVILCYARLCICCVNMCHCCVPALVWPTLRCLTVTPEQGPPDSLPSICITPWLLSSPKVQLTTRKTKNILNRRVASLSKTHHSHACH